MATTNARSNRKPGRSNRPRQNPQSVNGGKQGKTPGSSTGSDLFSKTNSYLLKNSGKVLIASLLLTLVFSILLFDIRFSLAGDDSAYVERAFNFVRHFVFPSFQGPLYPIFLGPFVAVFGISAIPLKSISLICMLGFVYFMYRVLIDNVPPLVMTITLILLSVNSSLLYYSSQTYTEAFFLFLQSVTFFLFFKLFVGKVPPGSFRTLAVNHLILSVLLLGLVLTRPIGFASVLAIAVFFLLRAEWKNLLYFPGSFTLVFLVFLALKSMIWGSAGFMFSGQASSFMAKDYYSPGSGMEDAAGFVNRFIQNSNYYISKTVYVFMGLREGGRDTAALTWLTVLTVLLVCGLLFMIQGKNLFILFTIIYTAVSMAGIFLITQVMWLQDRYIISYFPLVLLLLVSFFYYLFCLKKLAMFQFVLPVLFLALLISALEGSSRDILVVKQIKDQYSGLTPDWQNYCRMSEWTTNNLPSGALIACRKPSISFIYSRGGDFFGIAKVPAISGDSMVQGELQKKQHYTFIQNYSISNHPVPNEIYYKFKKWLVGYGIMRKPTTVAIPCYILKIPDSLRDGVVQEMRNERINITNSFDTVNSWVHETQFKITIVFADSLVNLLRRSGVTHILTASLRADGATRNGNTDNTVERYVEYIRYKYPGFFTRLCQVGATDDEPTFLYKLNYNMLRPDEASRDRPKP
jgi:hypothetical protein